MLILAKKGRVQLDVVRRPYAVPHELFPLVYACVSGWRKLFVLLSRVFRDPDPFVLTVKPIQPQKVLRHFCTAHYYAKTARE